MLSLDLRSDEFDLVKDLLGRGARFLVIGGYATKFFGCRTTVHDLDILIENSRGNASRVYPALVTALNKLRYSPVFTEHDLTLTRKQLRFPNAMVDVLTSSNRVDFGQAWERRERSVENGIEIPISSRKDLIEIKKEAAEDPERRQAELSDIACLERK